MFWAPDLSTSHFGCLYLELSWNIIGRTIIDAQAVCLHEAILYIYSVVIYHYTLLYIQLFSTLLECDSPNPMRLWKVLNNFESVCLAGKCVSAESIWKPCPLRHSIGRRCRCGRIMGMHSRCRAISAQRCCQSLSSGLIEAKEVLQHFSAQLIQEHRCWNHQLCIDDMGFL